MRWRSMAPVLVAAVAAVGGCRDDSETYVVEPTSKCLSATGVRVDMFEATDPAQPVQATGAGFVETTGGSLLARGAYDVTVLFGADAAEAEAAAEKLERYEYLDPFEGREYRFVVRRRSNAVVSARVPNDEEPTSDLGDVLDAAERCLRPA
jgi:hypothetical protein